MELPFVVTIRATAASMYPLHALDHQLWYAPVVLPTVMCVHLDLSEDVLSVLRPSISTQSVAPALLALQAPLVPPDREFWDGVPDQEQRMTPVCRVHHGTLLSVLLARRAICLLIVQHVVLPFPVAGHAHARIISSRAWPCIPICGADFYCLFESILYTHICVSHLTFFYHLNVSIHGWEFVFFCDFPFH